MIAEITPMCQRKPGDHVSARLGTRIYGALAPHGPTHVRPDRHALDEERRWSDKVAPYDAANLKIEKERQMSAKTKEQTQTPEKAKPVPGTGHIGQTYLVGEHIYLRPLEPSDAETGTSWRQSVFPQATDRIETWIKEDMPKEQNTRWYAIIRKQDDRVVGSLKTTTNGAEKHLYAQVDPLFGEDGQRWKGEALVLVAHWQVDEQERPMVLTALPATEQIAIEIMEQGGLREVARFREMLLLNGQRVDQVEFEYLNKQWLANIGDPRDVPLERTGIGEARPVPPRVTLDGDPPKNAIMIGSRVYLCPEQTEDSLIAASDSREEAETFFARGRNMESSVILEHWRKESQSGDLPTEAMFAVRLRETDEPIGVVFFFEANYVHGHAETGSFFYKDFRGNGYGSEAKHLLLEYIFQRLGLHMVRSLVLNQNTRSAAALRKQGYTEAGARNWVRLNKGKLDGFVVFDLLAAEWRALPRKSWSK